VEYAENPIKSRQIKSKDMKRNFFIGFLALSVLGSQAQIIKSYTEKDGVESQICFDSKQDGTGNIWFAGNKGLSKWDGTKFTFIKVEKAQWGNKLLLDTQKNILIYHNLKFLAKIKDNQLVEFGSFSQIASDANGIVWGINDKSLFRYDGNQIEKFCSDKNTTLSETFLDSKGNVWLASGEGIYKIKNKEYIRFSKENGVDGSYVSSFFEDSKKRIWVTTSGSGVFCYSNDHWIVYTKKDNLFNDDIMQITEDQNGLLWTAHVNSGVCYYDGTKWVEDNRVGSGLFHGNTATHEPTNTLNTSIIKTDSLNNIWMAYKGGDVLKYNGKEWEKQLHVNIKSLGLELYISKFNKNNIWFKSCTDRLSPGIGLNKYDLRTNKLTNVSNDNVYKIVEGGNGIMWFLTEDGLYKYDDINGYSKVVEGKIATSYYLYHGNNLLIDKTGNVWVGFKDGIYCISDRP
jgi:ligand-binding sensor domain-containing protein